MTYVRVLLEDLTDRQLHLHLLDVYAKHTTTLNRLDRLMTDLTTSIEDLKGAVDNVAVRFASQVAPLTEALAAAQAANDETNAELTAALADASAAADAIESEVTELNSLGAAPEVPVEAVPVEDLPPAPSEGSDPAGDPAGVGEPSGDQPVEQPQA